MRRNCEDSPRHGRQQENRNVIPEWLRVLVEIGAEALEIVLKKENAEELRNAVLHRQVPRQGYREEQDKPGNGNAAEKNFSVATQRRICAYHQHGQRGRHRAFGQSAHPEQRVKQHQPDFLAGLAPGPPAHHGQANGAETSMSVDAPRPKPIIPAEEAVINAASSSLVKRNRRMKKKMPKTSVVACAAAGTRAAQSRHTKNAVAVHHLPVEQRRLFQPRRAVQCGNNPIMPGQHFTRDLRVPRLVGAGEAKCSQAKKEKEVAHAQRQARAV